MAATGRLFSEMKRWHLKGGQGAPRKNSFFFFFPKEALAEQLRALSAPTFSPKKAQILPGKGARLPGTARRCLPLGSQGDPADLNYPLAAGQAAGWAPSNARTASESKPRGDGSVRPLRCGVV